jgi:hypothetical protein
MEFESLGFQSWRLLCGFGVWDWVACNAEVYAIAAETPPQVINPEDCNYKVCWNGKFSTFDAAWAKKPKPHYSMEAWSISPKSYYITFNNTS